MTRQKMGGRRWWRLWAMVLVWAGAWGQGRAVVAQEGAEGGVTDEQVVAAMKKGADFLLKAKAGDNWEVEPPKWSMGPNEEHGGETALVLYSLLHAGQSLQDEPEYQAKLHWRQAGLAPVLAWLAKQDLTETYAVGLRASALTLLPKRPDDKPGEGPQAALERDKAYLINAMGLYGGYDYSYQWATKTTGTFWTAWEAYFQAKMRGDTAAMDEAKSTLNTHIGSMRGSFGGIDGAFGQLVAQLRLKRKGADEREAARLDRELKEAQSYYANDLPKPGEGFAESFGEAKSNLDMLLDAQRRGDLSKVTKWDGGQNKNVPATREDMPALIEAAKAAVERTGYALKNNFMAVGDLSNGQYGTLGAWALADYGIELPNRYWEVQDRFWRQVQNADGGWTYYVAENAKLAESRPSMTVAGIASLFVAQEFVDTQLRAVPRPDKNIDAGLAWLNKNFAADTGNYYYMYGVERVGLASGLKFFGTKDWYKEGARAVVKAQAADGSFEGEYGPEVTTAYALLFLARGRNPVVFNKLQYNGPWNARPRDDAYVTRWLSTKRFEKPINWQVVNLQVSAQEWLDAPILLITGSADPRFSKAEVAKLREFVSAGGMIFSTADEGSTAFTAAMKRYAGEICDRRYEMRLLPRSHPLFSREMGVDLVNPPPLLGVSNGVREIWIHSPQDVGADWQTRKFSSKNFELGAALYLYATGMGSLRSKLQPLAVDVGTAPAKRSIAVARVDYAGNADPEPGAWARMAKLARAHFATDVTLTTVKFAELDAKKQRLAYLTGTAAMVFSDDEAKALKAYLAGGGMLLVDAAGGNTEFAESAKRLIQAACGETALQPLPPDHVLFTGAMPDGVKAGAADFRKYGRIKLQRVVAAPELEAVTSGQRVCVLYSPWDICSGFLGTRTWGIVGYNPATSEALGRNILLYAIDPNAKAEAAPAN